MSDNGNTALATRTDQAPAAYGDKPQVRSLAERIMALDPSFRSIGQRGVMLKAQLGIALGLNPLPGTGHIHVWLDGDNLCVHVGLEGRMALARAESPFSVSTRLMSAAEADAHGLQHGDRGAVAELYRIDLTERMHRAGIPVKPMTGIGVAKSNERIVKGRSLQWRADQRAIKDAIRLAYSFRLPVQAIEIMSEAGATFADAIPEGAEIIEGELNAPDERPAEERLANAATAQSALWDESAAAAGEEPDEAPEVPAAPLPAIILTRQVAPPPAKAANGHTSTRGEVIARWSALVDRAAALSIIAPSLKADATRDDIIAAGKALLERIKAAEAAVDAAMPQSGGSA